LKLPRWLIVIGVALTAAWLALQLSGVVYVMLVLPASYLLWLLKLLYLAMPGEIWWGMLVLALLLIFVASLVPEVLRVRGKEPLRRAPMGSVETLSMWMEKSQNGIYYKWLVANRLGRIAHRLLEQRAADKRLVSDGLAGPGWSPDARIQAYLETGLQGSFADYPRGNNPLARSAPTPLDHDIAEVVEFVESSMDRESSPQSRRDAKFH
jgi:hypothetical protein